MSARITHLVWENFPHGGNTKLVALCLADWANDTGEIIGISNQAVAKKTGLGLRTVQRSIHEITQLGWLEGAGTHIGGRGIRATYRMKQPAIKGANLTPFIELRKPRQSDTLLDDEIPEKTSKLPKKPRSKNHAKLAPKYIYINYLQGEGAGMDLLEDTWMQFVDYRKDIKKPLTERAALLALRKLKEYESQGQEPWRIINQSILNHWVGLFPVKDKEKPATGAAAAGYSRGTSITQRGQGYDNQRQKTTISAAEEVRQRRLARRGRDDAGRGTIIEGECDPAP